MCLLVVGDKSKLRLWKRKQRVIWIWSLPCTWETANHLCDRTRSNVGILVGVETTGHIV